MATHPCPDYDGYASDTAKRIIRQCCWQTPVGKYVRNWKLPRPAGRGSVVEAFLKKSKIQASLGDPGRALQNNRGMACSRTVNFRRAQLVCVLYLCIDVTHISQSFTLNSYVALPHRMVYENHGRLWLAPKIYRIFRCPERCN